MRLGSRGPTGHLAGLAVAEVAWIATRSWSAGLAAWLPLLAVIVLHLALVGRVRRGQDLPAGVALVAVVLVALAAVAVPPYGSRDLFQYAFYGHMAVHHGADPYVVAPDVFSADPLYAALAPGWHGARSVYGPVFTAFSMFGAGIFGGSVLGARLWFQGAAALALVGSAVRLRREVGTEAAVAVGLSPVLVATVNGGHNDLLVGWLVLVALGPSLRKRPAWCGAVLGVATCVKASAVPMVLAVGVAAAHRRAWRPLAVGASGWAAVSIASYGLGGGIHLLAPLGAVGARTSRASAWAVLERVGGGTAAGAVFLAAAGAAMVLVVVIVSWRWRSAPLATTATAAGAAACFAAPYVLVWYPASVLPVSGRASWSRAAVVLHVGSTALLLAYVVPAGMPTSAVPLAPAAAVGCGVALVALVGALICGPDVVPGYRRRGGQLGTGARRRGGVPRVSAARGLAGGGRSDQARRLP